MLTCSLSGLNQLNTANAMRTKRPSAEREMLVSTVWNAYLVIRSMSSGRHSAGKLEIVACDAGSSW